MSESRFQRATAPRRIVSRHLVAGAGMGCAAIGLADRLAFKVTWLGAVPLVLGMMLLVVVMLTWQRLRSDSDFQANLVFTGLFLLLALLCVVRPYQVDAVIDVLMLLVAITFLVLEAPWTRRYKPWVVLALLLAAQTVLMYRLPYPKQDVFRMLTYTVDNLARLHNPFDRIVDPVSPDVRPFYLTYPPGAFLEVAPFRLLLGDVRWAFIVGEVVYVAVALGMARQADDVPAWRQALVLVPLVLPAVSQAYFDYGNHDWVLVGLTAAAFALRRRALLSGALLGLGIVSKQYFVLFPLLFLLPWFSRRTLAAGAITAVLICVPFLAWNAQEFVRSVLFQLISPLDPDRLSLYGILRASHHDPGAGGLFGLAVLGLGLAGACAWFSRRRPKDLGLALVACGVGLLLFTFLAKYAAYNYYGYALTFVAWGLAVSDPQEREEARGARGVLGVPREAVA